MNIYFNTSCFMSSFFVILNNMINERNYLKQFLDVIIFFFKYNLKIKYAQLIRREREKNIAHEGEGDKEWEIY